MSIHGACFGLLFGVLQTRMSNVLSQTTTSALDNFPAGLMAPGAVLETLASARNSETYDDISNAVKELVDALPLECDNSACPRGEFAGCVVRLAGHDFMDFNGDDFGGSDGCVDFADSDNAGLKPCLVDGENGTHLNEAFEKFSDEVSLADFLVIAAEAVMHRQRGNLKPPIDFASGFTWGRVTRTECAVETSEQQMLPNPDDSCAANEKTFVNNLNLTWRETAALMGVHTLGRARAVHSGFDGWWSDAQSQNSFNNNYYISMTLKGWAPETVAASGKSQWRRVGNFSAIHNEMMLNTDLCLGFSNMDGSDINAVERINANDDCCAWMMPSAFPTSADAKLAIEENAEKNHWCGFGVDADRCAQGKGSCGSTVTVRHWCCTMGTNRATGPDCNSITDLGGRAAVDILEFASHEGVWLHEFKEAWRKATQARPTTTTTTTTTRACLDISGIYSESASGGNLINLTQGGCSGNVNGVGGGLTYTVFGSVVTVSTGVNGNISGSPGSFKIVLDNSKKYQQACLDISGIYSESASGGNLVDLTQVGCFGNVSQVGIEGNGWNYTVNGSVATGSNGVIGSISGSPGFFTIELENGETYKQSEPTSSIGGARRLLLI
jgi:hypothetical protein